MAALVLAPVSGWLVRGELLMASSGAFQQATAFLYPEKYNDKNRASDAARIAAQNEGDVSIQIAACQRRMPVLPDNQNTQGTRRAFALFPLREKYGNSPALHATILRFLSQDSVHILDRTELNLLKSDSSHPYEAGSDPKMNRPESMAAWEEAASAGEKLDPNNAYFPLMHAVGLFAAHRDEEALAAVRRAGEKTTYNEYTADEVEGQWRLNEQAHGKTGFVTEMAISAAQLYPHYSQLRQLARLVTAKAIQSEMAGDAESGFQNRMALTRTAALMRQGSKPLIGVLVGRAIGCIAYARPGGALPLPKVKNASDRAAQEKRAQENLNRYCAHLAKIGHDEAANEVRWESAASDKYRNLWNEGENHPDNVWGNMRSVIRLISLWAAGLGLLANLFSILVLGGLFTVLARNPRMGQGLPLTKASRAGILCAFGLPAYGFLVAQTWPENVSLALLTGGFAALGVTIFKAAQTGIKGKKTGAPSEKVQVFDAAQEMPVRSFWKAFALTAVVLGGFGIMGSVGAVQTMQAGGELIGDFTGNRSAVSPLLLTLLGVGASSAVSLLMLAGFALRSRIKRVPASVGMVRGFRRFALPVAAGLVFLYAGVVCQTVREEARASAAMHQCVTQGEAAYISRLLNKPLIPRYSEVAQAKDK